MQLPLLDESAKFSCGSCTSCCDQPWRTLIEADKAERLDQHDFSAYPQLQGKPLYHRPSDKRKDFYELAKGEGTRCVFLDTDGLCIIHKELGPQAKPKMCRQFPFLSARSWRDVRVSVNYGCPSVQNSSGQRLGEQAAEIAATVPQMKGTFQANALVPLDMKCKLSQEECETIFERALTLFDEKHAQDVWSPFAELLEMLIAVRTDKIQSGDKSENNGRPLGEMPEAGSSPPTSAMKDIRAFSSATAAPMPIRMLFATTLYPDTVPAESAGGLGLFQRLARIPKLLTLTTLSGGYASRLLGRNISITEVMQHEVDEVLEPAGTRLLLRYFRSRFWQRMMAGSKLPIIAGVHQHICDLNAIVFLARAEAAEQGKSCLDLELIRKALTRVEFHLANQVRLHDHTLKGWIRSQLCDPSLALQSLRLMALRRMVEPIAPVGD